MEYETIIPSGSDLINKTFGEIRKEFKKIEIDHYHPSPVFIETRENRPANSIPFKEGMTVKFIGDYKEIRNLRAEYDLF